MDGADRSRDRIQRRGPHMAWEPRGSISLRFKCLDDLGIEAMHLGRILRLSFFGLGSPLPNVLVWSSTSLSWFYLLADSVTAETLESMHAAGRLPPPLLVLSPRILCSGLPATLDSHLSPLCRYGADSTEILRPATKYLSLPRISLSI
jgi:hypothetical protein